MFHVYSETIAIRWIPFLLAIGQVLVLDVNRTPQSLSQAGKSGNSPSISQEKGPSPTDFKWHFLISCNSLATMARWWIYAKVPWPEHGWWWRAMCPRTVFIWFYMCAVNTRRWWISKSFDFQEIADAMSLGVFKEHILWSWDLRTIKKLGPNIGNLKSHTFYLCPHEDIATIAYTLATTYWRFIGVNHHLWRKPPSCIQSVRAARLASWPHPSSCFWCLEGARLSS